MAKFIRLTADEVATAADLAGVPPALALSVWQQESSSGKNTNTSLKGARGAFQVMPATFDRYMPKGSDIDNPVDNMHAGLAVLADGLRQSGGDYEGAAQFYYHGGLLKPGESGPNSGPNTPNTREYGKGVANRARLIAAQRGGSDATKIANAAAGTPIQTADQEFGAGEPDTEAAEQDTNPADPMMASADTDEADDMPGFTGPMNGAMTQHDGQHDDAMNTQGSDNYDLEQYIRHLVDDEFKNSNA